MPNFKLNYFNGRGRAETIRLVFAAAGQKYEDTRFEMADWPSKKKDFKFGHVPVLEVDNEQLNQSVAILQYLAVQFGLAGKTPLDAAKCHAYVETFRDCWLPFMRKVFSETDNSKRPQLIKDAIGDVKAALAPLEEVAKEAKGSFLVAGQLTSADLECYTMLDMFVAWYGVAFLNDFKFLQQHYKLVANQPKIKEYLAKRPNTPF